MISLVLASSTECSHALFSVFLFVVSFLVGFLWPRGRKISNPKPSRFADGEYYKIWIQNQAHLFTEEQVSVARQRAIRLGVKD